MDAAREATPASAQTVSDAVADSRTKKSRTKKRDQSARLLKVADHVEKARDGLDGQKDLWDQAEALRLAILERAFEEKRKVRRTDA